MPLTTEGKQILKDFQSRYGKKEGRRIFYQYVNKFPKRTRRWHNG